jgi:predicted PurR-regulated permease PerM
VRELLDHPWVKVLLAATTIAMCTFALRETAWIILPIALALKDVLVPVAIGFAIAYVLTPVVDAIARQSGVRRFFAAGILFGVVAVGAVLAMVLLVPAVLHEGSALTQRVFQGEPYEDLNHNGRYDPGEPFEDQNGNKVWDRGLLASGLSRLEEWQARLKVKARLAFDDPELAYLALYADDTAELRTYLERMLGAARAGAPVERWPAAPADVDESRGAVEREFSWPSPSAASVNEAEALVAPDLRERWRTEVRAADAALADHHAHLIAALDLARSGSDDAMAVRIRDAWRQPLQDERRATAQRLADSLEDAERLGQPGAHQAVTALRGEGAVGSRTLAALVQRLDDGVHDLLKQSPERIEGWTKLGIGSIESWAVFLFDALLVPIYAFFLVLAMPSIRHGVREYIPVRRRDQTIRIIRDIEQVVSAFFRGRLIICTLCALACWIGFTVISLFTVVSVPYALLFAIAIGFATTVPLSGILFLIPAVVMTLLQPHAMALHGALVLLVYALVQALEAVLIPLIMGREVELHPVMLIVALLLCGKLLGILGLILAVPIAATGRILAREYLWPRLRAWASRTTPASLPIGPGVDDGTPAGVPVLRDRQQP